MAKKRKTREQKIKAAQRQKQQVSPGVEAELAEERTSSTVTTSPVTDGAQSNTSALQARDLRASLALFLILVAVQIGLWVTFEVSGIDTRLYDAIQL